MTLEKLIILLISLFSQNNLFWSLAISSVRTYSVKSKENNGRSNAVGIIENTPLMFLVFFGGNLTTKNELSLSYNYRHISPCGFLNAGWILIVLSLLPLIAIQLLYNPLRSSQFQFPPFYLYHSSSWQCLKQSGNLEICQSTENIFATILIIDLSFFGAEVLNTCLLHPLKQEYLMFLYLMY